MDESNRLLGTRYNPATAIPQDRDMIDFFNWVISLPQKSEDVTSSVTENVVQSNLLPDNPFTPQTQTFVTEQK